MKHARKLLSLLLTLAMVCGLMAPAMAAEEETGETPAVPYTIPADVKGKLVVIHTNDTHGHDVAEEGKTIGTAGVVALKKEFEAAGASVLLLSAGDFSQGTTLVSLDKGASAIDFMNAAGYDAASLGNHEFDYKMDALKSNVSKAKFPVLAANIVETASNKPLSGDRVTFDTAIGKVGVFGLDTPETMTKAHPDNVKGLTFYQGDDLVKCAQAQVDALKADGCVYVIALTHLGVDPESEPNRSTDVFSKVNGVDLVVDGHSHTVMDGGEKVGNALVVSTGEYLNNVGVAITDGKTTTAQVVSAASYTKTDEEVAKIINAKDAAVKAELDKVFASTEVLLDGNRDPGVRTQETNLGDFAADAILWSARQAMGEDKVDIALTNGGGIRASIEAGDITMNTMKTVFPFGNEVATIDLTGAELLEALEAATCSTPTAIGAFPQVSGMAFTINTAVPYENGTPYPDSTYFAPANPGARITNVTVNGAPLDLNDTYTLATNDFTAAGGDTYGVFLNKTIYKTGVALEDALVNYTRDVLNNQITAAQYGQSAGRITVLASSVPESPAPSATSTPSQPPQVSPTPVPSLAAFSDLQKDAWYMEAVRYVVEKGAMNGTSASTFAPNGIVTRGTVYQTLYNLAGKPAVAEAASFTDTAGKWYAQAAAWAEDEGLTSGTGNGQFSGDKAMTRQELAKVFSDYANKNSIVPEAATDSVILGFEDAALIADWARPGMISAVSLGLLKGSANRLNPTGTAQRVELAQILMNFGKLSTPQNPEPVPTAAPTTVPEPASVSGKVTEVSKYGNLTLDLKQSDFTAAGFAAGDIVTLAVGDKTVEAPVGTGYSNVDQGNAIVVLLPGTDFVTAAVNMGSLAETVGAAVDSAVTLTMKEKAGYLEEYEFRNIDSLRTNNRDDYESDQIFANFRPVVVGTIAPGALYRSSSPINPELGRNTYADTLAKKAGIQTVLNLADSEETMKSYPGYSSSHYATCKVAALDMGVDTTSADFNAKLKTGLEFLIANEGPYLIHCTEGKDRAGFVSALLEALMGGTLEEITSDYMLSYENYYHVEKGSNQYQRIAESNILATLRTVAGLEKGSSLEGVNLQEAAEHYLMETVGLSAEQVTALRDNLSAPVSGEAAA